MGGVTIAAFSAEQACELAGISLRRLFYWVKSEVFVPEYFDVDAAIDRDLMYSFRDVVSLRTLAVLRDERKVSLQHLRSAHAWLRERYQRPWSELKFYTAGKAVVFGDPVTGIIQEAGPRRQTLLPIELGPIESNVSAKAAKLRERRREQIGQIGHEKKVLHNQAVIAGTRVPVAAIRDLHRAGYTVDTILYEYPALRREDVEAALAYDSKTA